MVSAFKLLCAASHPHSRCSEKYQVTKRAVSLSDLLDRPLLRFHGEILTRLEGTMAGNIWTHALSQRLLRVLHNATSAFFLLVFQLVRPIRFAKSF